MITINYYKSLSENSLTNPSTADKELVQDIYRLSCLMNELDRPVWHTFIVIFFTLEKLKKGLFFSANENNKKVAFGFCYPNQKNTDSKILEFFAVEEQYRGKGIGTSVIKKFIKDKVGNSSLMLSCSSELRKFYEQCGFKFTQNSDDSPGIVMSINDFDTNYYYERTILGNGDCLGGLEKIEKLYGLSFDKKEFSDKTSDFFVRPLTTQQIISDIKQSQRKGLFIIT
jgi:GNAT superfamily N-acetyltransferase